MKSLAAVLRRAKEPLELHERELPPPAPEEVTVRIEACGLGLADWNVAMLDALPVTPLTLGCEAVGREVVSGRRVGITPLATSCGRCASCAAGLDAHCAAATWHGFNRDGALCTVGNFSTQHLVPLPDAADAAPLAVLMGSGLVADAAVQAVRGARVGVFGLGGLGHLVLQLLGARGIGFELDPARQVGAPQKRPLDCAVVCVPSVQAIQQAFSLLEPRGRLVVAAQSPHGRFDLSLQALVSRGIEMVGAHLAGASVERVLARWSDGTLQPKVTVKPLADAPASLYALRDGGHLGRLVFVP